MLDTQLSPTRGLASTNFDRPHIIKDIINYIQNLIIHLLNQLKVHKMKFHITSQCKRKLTNSNKKNQFKLNNQLITNQIR